MDKDIIIKDIMDHYTPDVQNDDCGCCSTEMYDKYQVKEMLNELLKIKLNKGE